VCVYVVCEWYSHNNGVRVCVVHECCVGGVCVVGVWCGTRSASMYVFTFLQKF